jgi:putative membrane-bound dehydrogenase-like protein
LPAAAAASGQEPLPPEETVRRFELPEGFRALLFAAEPHVVQPIGFAIDDRGRLWVAENLSYPHWEPRGRDRIIILEDEDGDGRFDRRSIFAEGLTYVTGIEVGFGGVWVMAPPEMLFIPDRDGDDRPDGPPEVLLDGFGTEGIHNIANGFTWGPDGWLYAGHGRTSISRLGPPGTPPERRLRFDGGVWRYHPTRHVYEAFCDGTTNPWGVSFDDTGQAFISNCVDPHLFHAVQGAHFEPWRGRESSRHAYRRLDTVADHLHGQGEAAYRSAGGHAHCGIMIYLGDLFPPAWRGTAFMNNIHGRRVNGDRLRRSGSGFRASHGPDLLVSRDPHYVGLLLQYGPDGGVFVNDWYDIGECHTRRPQAWTGRIYKIVYGDPPRVRPNLGGMGDLDLARLQLHANDWFVTHARRRLQERAAEGKLDPGVHGALREILEGNPDPTRKLRALWALHATGGLDAGLRAALLDHPEEYVRGWAIQLEMEDGRAPEAVQRKFLEMARRDASPVVRLYLAAACRRMAPGPARWEILEALAGRAEDAKDPNLPLMVWYAAEPMAEHDPSRAAAFLARARLPYLREFMARRLASGR